MICQNYLLHQDRDNVRELFERASPLREDVMVIGQAYAEIYHVADATVIGHHQRYGNKGFTFIAADISKLLVARHITEEILNVKLETMEEILDKSGKQNDTKN